MSDLAALAERIGARQREMLLWNADWHVLLRPGFTRWRLKRKGLIEPFLPEYFRGAAWMPTERGEAVAAALRAKGSHNHDD